VCRYSDIFQISQKLNKRAYSNYQVTLLLSSAYVSILISLLYNVIWYVDESTV
jgi:hypothetical protein